MVFLINASVAWAALFKGGFCHQSRLLTTPTPSQEEQNNYDQEKQNNWRLRHDQMHPNDLEKRYAPIPRTGAIKAALSKPWADGDTEGVGLAGGKPFVCDRDELLLGVVLGVELVENVGSVGGGSDVCCGGELVFGVDFIGEPVGSAGGAIVCCGGGCGGGLVFGADSEEVAGLDVGDDLDRVSKKLVRDEKHSSSSLPPLLSLPSPPSWNSLKSNGMMNGVGLNSS
jgi:hypothetical protein